MAACSYCGKDAGYLHSVCPECRAAHASSTTQTGPLKFRDNPLAIGPTDRGGGSSLGTWVIGIVVALAFVFFLIMYLGSTPQAKEKGIKRMAIKQCWKDYERKSLDPSTKRFLASVCEKIERDFKQDYGVDP